MLILIAARSRQNNSIPANTSMYLRMYGTDNSTTFTDSGPNNFTITPTGTVSIKNGTVPFGGAAAYFDGTATYLSCPNNAAINNFGAGDFSISADIYCTDVSVERVIISCESLWTSSVAYLIELRAGGQLRFYAGNSVPVQIFTSTGAIANNTLYTVKVIRVGTTFTLYINGAAVGTATSSSSVSNSSNPKIGIFAQDNSSPWMGYMKNILVTKG